VTPSEDRSNDAVTTPTLIISLDFELYWGLRDCVPLDSYRDNLLGVRQAIPALLRLFEARGIHATWATVGFLFCRTKRELEATVPPRIPRYRDARLSPYDFSLVGRDEASDPFHFAPSLIEEIARTPGQEVATHTFSHFYCLEEGQTAEDFDADLASANVAAARLGVELKSLVFPRNQENPRYAAVLRRRGLCAFRSAGRRWPYEATAGEDSRLRRAVRLVDSYLPLSGRRTVAVPRQTAHGLVDIPPSAFLRPFSRRLCGVDALKLARIRRAMTQNAEEGGTFHLWWHPHNFGINLGENLSTLGAILDHFDTLSRTHGMRSSTMLEAAQALTASKSH